MIAQWDTRSRACLAPFNHMPSKSQNLPSLPPHHPQTYPPLLPQTTTRIPTPPRVAKLDSSTKSFPLSSVKSLPTNLLSPIKTEPAVARVVSQEKKNERRKDRDTWEANYSLSFSLIHIIEVLFDMTGYKTDSCSESSDDDDLPRGILSDSERHHRGLRKRFGRKSNLSKEQRQQLLEDIRQGNFLKPEESLAATQAERQGKD